ncbi:hypothetical protein RRF57_001673 [Xylaria bambusicola]|uniref:F-box domain-containing protein n=1 Tax=Xylaria bambusicola TaxID=326684 RepID=A0AAN7Z1T3_9PEZI
MVRDAELRASLIQRLPVELVREILENLPDVSSLYTAIVSCSLFHSVFLDAEEAITTAVLLTQIDVDVIPEAIMAHESARLRPHDKDPQCREAILDFVVRNLQQRPTLPRLWSLRKAFQLGQLHFYMDAFAKEFALSALSNGPLKHFNLAPTHQELCPTERTIAHISALIPAFNDVAEHDVQWGAANVEYDNQIDNSYTQTVLSLGLEKLYEISHAETYEERYRALDAKDSPHPNRNFLHAGLEEETNEQRDECVELGEITPDNERLYIKQPFYNDSNTGPKNAWRWAHIEECQSRWVYQEDRAELREWGYVMWDQIRLDMTGIFQGPWENTIEREPVLEDQEAGTEPAYMQNSWEQREWVSKMGGSGWWS